MQYELNTLRMSDTVHQMLYITPCIDTHIIGSPWIEDLSDYGIPLLRRDRINQRVENYRKKVAFDRKKEEGAMVASEGWRYPRQGAKNLPHLPEEFKVFTSLLSILFNQSILIYLHGSDYLLPPIVDLSLSHFISFFLSFPHFLTQ